jgi:hypothetical protein
MQRPVVLVASCALAVALSSSWARADDLPESIHREMQCMVEVLRKMPNIDQVQTGLVPYPFVQYRYSGQGRNFGTITFYGEDPKLPGYFMAFLPGGVDLALGGPPTYGADTVIAQWKAQCAVSANILFE